MSAGQTTEKAFETYVEEILLTKGGWKSGTNAEWDKERALFPARIFAFIQETQGKLSQIVPYSDAELEMLYSYGRFLLPHLPLDQ